MAALDTTACTYYYGDPTSKEFKEKYLVLYVLPDWMQKVFPVYQKITKVRKQWLHKDCKQALEDVFKALVDQDLTKELKSYGGGLNVRMKRGLNEYSIHSWGLAFDFNEAENPLGGKVRFSQKFLQVWRDNGWTCGADFKNRVDGMHFQYTGKKVKAYQEHLTKELAKKVVPKTATTPKLTPKSK